MRNLVSNQVIAKFEGHSKHVQSLTFVKGSSSSQKAVYSFLSSAGSELLLWEPSQQTLQSSDQIEEVLQPAKILDIESSNVIRMASGQQVMPGAYLVAAQSDSNQYVFLSKVTVKKDGKPKSKVKKPDSVISLAESNHQMIQSTVLDVECVQTLYGNLFSLLK